MTVVHAPSPTTASAAAAFAFTSATSPSAAASPPTAGYWRRRRGWRWRRSRSGSGSGSLWRDQLALLSRAQSGHAKLCPQILSICIFLTVLVDLFMVTPHNWCGKVAATLRLHCYHTYIYSILVNVFSVYCCRWKWCHLYVCIRHPCVSLLFGGTFMSSSIRHRHRHRINNRFWFMSVRKSLWFCLYMYQKRYILNEASIGLGGN